MEGEIQSRNSESPDKYRYTDYLCCCNFCSGNSLPVGRRVIDVDLWKSCDPPSYWKGFVTNLTIQTIALHLLPLQRGWKNIFGYQNEFLYIRPGFCYVSQSVSLWCGAFQQLRGWGSKIWVQSHLDYIVRFSREKKGMEKASFYLVTSDWNFLILSIYVT